MINPESNKPSLRRFKRWLKKHWIKVGLPVVLLPLMAYPFYDQHKSNKFRDDVGRRLTNVEQAVKENEPGNSIRRLANWINEKLEVIKQIKEKLKKGGLNGSEMKELIASIKDILNHIKSILNFFCSFGSKENKDT